MGKRANFVMHVSVLIILHIIINETILIHEYRCSYHIYVIKSLIIDQSVFSLHAIIPYYVKLYVHGYTKISVISSHSKKWKSKIDALKLKDIWHKEVRTIFVLSKWCSLFNALGVTLVFEIAVAWVSRTIPNITLPCAGVKTDNIHHLQPLISD